MFYLKLALLGIKKNKQLYYPYILAGICMVMVFYVFLFLGFSKVVLQLHQKNILPVVFICGAICVGFFSVPFLLYTNVSLLKKRKKELGLYSVLGMNKKNMMIMMFLEIVITYGVVIFFGSLFGIIFSRISELVLIKIMHKEVMGHFMIEWDIIRITGVLYLFIYSLISFNSFFQVCKSNPIELLHSDMEGERAPKKNGLLAMCSIALIASAYIMMIRFHIILFSSHFFCVIGFIIIGTFLLFIFASVFICNFLQSRKGYYYKTANFVTISCMNFRMKRNGAGLAAICLLTTMILTTLSVSLSAYTASRKLLDDYYPHDTGVSVSIPVEKMTDEIEIGEYTKEIQSELEKFFLSEKDARYFEVCSANLLGVLRDGLLDLSIDIHDTGYDINDVIWEKDGEKIVLLHFLSLDNYNKLCGTNESLNENEVLIASETIEYGENQIHLYDGATYRVSKRLKKIPPMREIEIDNFRLTAKGCEEIFLVVNDLYSIMGELKGLKHYNECNYLVYDWTIEADWEGKEDFLGEVYKKVTALVDNMRLKDSSAKISTYYKPEREEGFISVSGSAFFLVISINILLMIVISLIMYYKQLSEGYEDQKCFSILKKVGMTQDEIKSCICSQMMIVFALPLLVGTIHFVFTTKVLRELMQPSIELEMAVVVKYMLSSYFVVVLFYYFVYKVTSKKYYEIVSNCIFP